MELTSEQRAALDNLTRLQRGVVLERVKDPKATDAECYRRAGGTAKTLTGQTTSANQILTHRDVVEVLRLLQRPAEDAAIATRDEILRDLTTIARGTIFDVADVKNVTAELMDTETGELYPGQSVIQVKSADQIKPEHRIMIKSVKQTKYGLELTLHDAMTARKMLAEMQGLNAPQVIDHQSSDGSMSPLTRAQRSLIDKALDNEF